MSVTRTLTWGILRGSSVLSMIIAVVFGLLAINYWFQFWWYGYTFLGPNGLVNTIYMLFFIGVAIAIAWAETRLIG